MSSFRFPAIQTKKTLQEEEDYNFVNKDKKKKSTNNPLELVDELKRKIQQQKKQIDNRNITIQGLQRNFQSLSVIVKNEKAQTAALRAQLQNLKQTSQTGDKRASQFHQKYIVLDRENRALKEQLKSVRRAHAECGEYVARSEQFKKRILQLQETNEKLHGKYMQSESQRRGLEADLAKTKSLEKEKRLLNEQIVDMQSEIKKLMDINNGLQYRQVTAIEEATKLQNEIVLRNKAIQECKFRLKDSEKQRERLQFDIDFLKKQVGRLQKKIEESESMMENKQLFSKLKSEEEQKIRKQYRDLLFQYNQLEDSFKKVVSQSEQKTAMVNYAHQQIEVLNREQGQLKDKFKSKEDEYQLEIQKLMKSIKELHQQLDISTGESSNLNKKLFEEQLKMQSYNDRVSNMHQNIEEMNKKMQEHQERYGYYLKLINKNEPDVVITNQRQMEKIQNGSASVLSKLNGDIQYLEKQIAELESNAIIQTNNGETMKKYIKNLQEEVATKSEEIMAKTRLLRQFQQEEEELNKMIMNERNLSEKLKIEAQMKVYERMRELQNQKLRSQKQIEDERRRLEEQIREQKLRNDEKLRKERQKSQKYSKLLEEYKSEEQKLKQMMTREQQDLARLSQEKEQQIKRLIRQKEDELEREKKNNKLLWSDNKKLKDLENKLKQDSKHMLEEKEAAKREEVQRLKRQLERKYKEDMNSMKNEESNSHELKKILSERTNQFKQLTENYNKLKGETQFYKNRNKQLQSLVSRIQKQFKDKTIDLQRENKSNKQVIEVLDKKLKESQLSLSEAEKKQKRELKYLYDEIEEMRNKAKSQKVEQKLSLVSKSMGDLDTSLKTLMNTLSCNYCVQIVKECVRLECGHIYCKKCKGGYEPNCGECKKKSNPVSDKMIDESVSKAQYMRILITTIKDDLSKISM